MAYTTIDKPSDYFNTVLYTGDGTSPRSITGVGFQPDWNWSKSRSSADYDHLLADSVRGTSAYYLKSNSTVAETGNPAAGYLSSFDSDGYTLTSGASNNTNYNASSVTYVSWNWLAGGTASSNTDGSITSSVSANTTAGFSIVSYTGTGSNATVGHGLGAEAKMIIFKDRDTAAEWRVYHVGSGNTGALDLNTTDAIQTNSVFFQDTTPTSSVFSLGTGTDVNNNTKKFIAYCFAEKKGFSRFGSYQGSGNSDGPMIWCGFKPAFVMIKRSSASGNNWFMYDNKRDPFNPTDLYLAANDNGPDATFLAFDILSNGIKLKTTNTGFNNSGDTYIYMMFAESPFVTSSGIPTCAR